MQQKSLKDAFELLHIYSNTIQIARTTRDGYRYVYKIQMLQMRQLYSFKLSSQPPCSVR
jgi:hypothetical protein